MKTVWLFFFVIIGVFPAFSQKVIEKPTIGIATTEHLKLDKIELAEEETTLWFHVELNPGDWINFSKTIYIQPVGSDEKMFLKRAVGVSLNENIYMDETGEKSYALVFPKIDPNTSKLDYGDTDEGAAWFIYDILLKPELFQSVIPDKLLGSWFRADNAALHICLFDSAVIYQSEVWKYEHFSDKENPAKIGLRSGNNTRTIYIQNVNDSVCLIGELPAKMTKCINHFDVASLPADTSRFRMPIFKADTIVYRGYIRNYNPRYLKQTSGTVYMDNILTGEQQPHLLRIEDDGSFDVKFSYFGPQEGFVRAPLLPRNIFLYPGKMVFQIIDQKNIANPVLFMGDGARLNMDWLKVQNIHSFDFQKMQKEILDQSPKEYKEFCWKYFREDMDAFEKIALEYPFSEKAVQLFKLRAEQSACSKMMAYSMYNVSAWREQNNIPHNQWKIDYEPEEPDSSYYDFLTTSFVNEPLGTLTFEYSTFINRLAYLDILRGDTPISVSTKDIIDKLIESGKELRPDEKLMVEQQKILSDPDIKKLQEEFNSKHAEQAQAFYSKYMKDIQKSEKDEPWWNTIESSLSEKGVELNPSEKEFLEVYKVFQENPLIKEMKGKLHSLGDVGKNFHTDHREVVNELLRDKSIKVKTERLQQVLGIEPGWGADVLICQAYCEGIISKMTPISDEELLKVQAMIKTPFIFNYLKAKNDEVKQQIEANKKSSEAEVREVPQTEADKVFDAIISKYKGKVVYVDFWATWCGPCRAGMTSIKPLKEELEGEDVVFVYITNQTSPVKTYENMIPTIKGEHYRVSADEWNFLGDKFNISGIPHYVLVDKNGTVVNPHLASMGNDVLRTLLLKYANQ